MAAISRLYSLVFYTKDLSQSFGFFSLGDIRAVGFLEKFCLFTVSILTLFQYFFSYSVKKETK